MTVELVGGLVALLVTLIFGSIGWQQVKEHGAQREKRKQAEEERDDERVRADAASVAPARPNEASEILRGRLARLSERKRRLQDGAGRRH